MNQDQNNGIDFSCMESFYGSDEYIAMIASGKISRGMELFVLEPIGQFYTIKRYSALNQSRVVRGESKKDPRDALDGRRWFVDKASIDPLERMACKNR